MNDASEKPPREWWIESGKGNEGRIFEIDAGKIFIEYRGKPLLSAIHVIEYSAFEAMKRERDEARLALEYRDEAIPILRETIARERTERDQAWARIAELEHRNLLEAVFAKDMEIEKELDSYKAECQALRACLLKNSIYAPDLAEADRIREERSK